MSNAENGYTHAEKQILRARKGFNTEISHRVRREEAPAGYAQSPHWGFLAAGAVVFAPAAGLAAAGVGAGEMMVAVLM
jgi:hypothetical protein